MKRLTIDTRPILALAAACACWGSATVITKSLLASVSPLTLLALQLTVSVAGLWGLLLIRGRRRLTRREMIQQGLLGWLNPGLSYTFSLLGLAAATASLSTLLWATEPILILGLAWLGLRERLSGRLTALSGVAVLGVLLVSGLLGGSALAAEWQSTVLILAGVLCCALYTVLARRLNAETDTLFSLAVQQSAALIWAAALWPFECTLAGTVTAFPADWPAWIGSGLAGLLYYALAFWFYLHGLRRVRASLAGAMLNLTPVFGVAGGYLFLGERLASLQWLGAGLILAAVLGIVVRPAEPAPATPS
ncbi:MAG: DMT family transporter [Anaerolineales bacterium]|nr:DMT family transporter [Anaerolineales bacterium]